MSFSPGVKCQSSVHFPSRRSTSLIYSSDYLSPKLKNKANTSQIIPNQPLKIHERLYQESKLKKRCDSNQSLAKPKMPRMIFKKNFYQDSKIQQAENRKNCIILRRNLTYKRDEELKFTPTISKFHFSAPRRTMPLEDYLILTELYKRSDRYKLIRKHGKACN